ncbi:MAG: SDR family NAD(P)-dependent oxidoreductase [Dehalococcoidia bacterium]
MKLEDKVALVTGAGSGIGKAIALAFAKEGAKVAVNDEDVDGIELTLEEIRKLGGEGFGVKADVSSSQEVKDMFSKLLERFGTLDILVNNAGIIKISDKVKDNFPKYLKQMATTGVVKMSLEATRYMTDEEWRRMIDVHLCGTFYCTREALNIMEDKGYGKIINIASICGISGSCAGSPDYSAAKGGIVAFTKSVAVEVIGRGVYVNAIAPGYINTPGLMAALPPQILTSAIVRTPLGRLGTTEEIAPVAVFLASDESSFMVGQIISPNGGTVI